MPQSAALAAAEAQPLITDERLQHLYTTLLRGRLLRSRNRLPAAAPALVAREAIVTGTVTHLQDGDSVAPADGDRLAALARGHSLRRLLASDPLPGVLSLAGSAGSRFAFAAGYALARRGEKKVTLAYSGPGLRSLDALRPALACAAAHKLEIVFVIETPAEAEISGARHTRALGLYGIPVDGNDVVALYRVAQEAIARARRGVGPTIIDCKPWPLAGPADPVRRLEQALAQRGLPTDRLRARTLAAFRKELNANTRKPR